MDNRKRSSKTENQNQVNFTIGNNIRKLRKLNGITQQVLSESLNVTFQQLQKYEKGKNYFPACRLPDLAKFFLVPINTFFEDK